MTTNGFWSLQEDASCHQMHFFQVAETPQESAEEIETYARYRYPTMTKTQGNFKLKVVEGEFTDSQIIVMLGENGTGKTTFIRMLVYLFLLYRFKMDYLFAGLY